MDPLTDEALLRYYAQEWDRYTTGANYINRLFTYLNRHWVKREKDEGRKGVYPVYTASTRSEHNYLGSIDLIVLSLAGACSMEDTLFPPHPRKEPETG